MNGFNKNISLFCTISISTKICGEYNTVLNDLQILIYYLPSCQNITIPKKSSTNSLTKKNITPCKYSNNLAATLGHELLARFSVYRFVIAKPSQEGDFSRVSNIIAAQIPTIFQSDERQQRALIPKMRSIQTSSPKEEKKRNNLTMITLCGALQSNWKTS